MKGPYEIRVSADDQDEAWDRFLQETPGASHVQSTPWGRVKETLGWQARRLVALRRDSTVAGAQILVRHVPLLGRMGYVPSGPVVAEADPDLQTWFAGELLRCAQSMGIKVLAVQPPPFPSSHPEHLKAVGFRPSQAEMALTATTILDLSPDLDDILAAMKSKTRYNIRRGQRKGITVRSGTGEADVAQFHDILVATGKRQGFKPLSLEYLSTLVDTFESLGHCRLFLAEYQGEPVSGMLAISFGDTVVYKRGAWAGIHGDKRPNEAMHWAAIRWSKEAGYRYYDFDGMEPLVAQQILAGSPIPDDQVETVTRFKLGFGGAVVQRPGVYEYLEGGPLAAAWRIAHSKQLTESRVVARLKALVR